MILYNFIQMTVWFCIAIVPMIILSRLSMYSLK